VRARLEVAAARDRNAAGRVAAREDGVHSGGARDGRDGSGAAGSGGTLAEARKTLKGFPGIADPGADRILLFAGVAPVAAVPSNVPHVLVRILQGPERENYGVTYRDAQEAIPNGVGDGPGAAAGVSSGEASWPGDL
jgi:hypothetical protein